MGTYFGPGVDRLIMYEHKRGKHPSEIAEAVWSEFSLELTEDQVLGRIAELEEEDEIRTTGGSLQLKQHHERKGMRADRIDAYIPADGFAQLEALLIAVEQMRPAWDVFIEDYNSSINIPIGISFDEILDLLNDGLDQLEDMWEAVQLASSIRGYVDTPSYRTFRQALELLHQATRLFLTEHIKPATSYGTTESLFDQIMHLLGKSYSEALSRPSSDFYAAWQKAMVDANL